MREQPWMRHVTHQMTTLIQVNKDACKSPLVPSLSQAKRIECAVRAVIKLHCTDVSCEWVSCLQFYSTNCVRVPTNDFAKMGWAVDATIVSSLMLEQTVDADPTMLHNRNHLCHFRWMMHKILSLAVHKQQSVLGSKLCTTQSLDSTFIAHVEVFFIVSESFVTRST